ncbi:MAG TPA: type II toxin-antitoxin system MqsA family antitoxin [Longimicrobium sp.]|nr:type II toxin-antitoxin system MqsA family antitoxin [Longimicrobium sp.]
MIEPCPLCDGEARLVREPRAVPVGARTVTVDAELLRCGACGETYFAPGQMREAQRAAADVVRGEEGLLTPSEILEIRKRYGLSQTDLERLLGTGPKTVTRWERGSVPQNATADTLLRVLRDWPEVVRRLAGERGMALRGAPGERSGGHG